MPPVMRYAASGRHRNGSRTGSPETGTKCGHEELTVAQRQNGLGRCSQHREQRRRAITDVASGIPACREVHQAAPQLWLLGPDDPGHPPETALPHRRVGGALADAASDDPQRGWVVVIPLGQPADEIGHFRRQPNRAVDVGLAGVSRPGVGDVEDIPCLADVGRRVTGVGQPIAENAGGIGLSQNRERAWAIGGRLRVGISSQGCHSIACANVRGSAPRIRRCRT